jgi:hypothetical protein
MLRALTLQMRFSAEVGLLIALAFVSFLYFDRFVSEGYTRSSLSETQNEARTFASLLRHELTPGKLEMLAKNQHIPFERLKAFSHSNIPTESSAYRCGKLTFFFDANDQLVDLRGHLLHHSLLLPDAPDESGQPNP